MESEARPASLVETRMSRRRFGASLLAVASVVFAASAGRAADYPSHPIRLIVPFLPGAGTDLSARIVAKKLTERLGQPVVVENRPGGGGVLANTLIAQSPPDGYTLLWGEASGVTIQPTLRRDPPYRLESFTYISKFVDTGMAFVVPGSIPVRTIAEFRDYAAANRGKLNYGSPGVGTATHLATQLFVDSVGADMEHIAYQGVSAMVNDLLAGRIQLGLMTPASLAAYRGSDLIRPIGISAPERHPLLPEVPTAREAGLPAAEVTTWYGLLTPAGLPASVRQRLLSEMAAISKDPEVIQQISKINLQIVPVLGDDFTELVRRETEMWRRIIVAKKITAD